jgi:hypothetical protein
MVPNDIQIYCGCIERVRHHVSVADTVLAGKINTGRDDLNSELIFLHLRKALEEIAFSSLAANREKYSAARAQFATDWRAKGMLEHVAKVNPQFWPIPVTGPQQIAPGHKHFDRVRDGFLTREDFVVLYDAASVQALHTRNPYAPSDGAVELKYTLDRWSTRIKTLLSLHCVKLVDVHGLWVVRVGNEGPVEALTAVTNGDFAVAPI